jgi:hypothetical protein
MPRRNLRLIRSVQASAGAARGPLLGAAAITLCLALPVLAQDRSLRDGTPDTTFAPAPSASFGGGVAEAGSSPDSLAGRAGQRRTRDQVTGVAPMARIQNRIINRVQSRISNRLGRRYNGSNDVTSPFKAAADEVQSTTPAR